MNSSPLKKFIIHYSQFLGTGVVSQMLGFITFPILTRLLSKEQYGMMGLVTTTMLLAVALAKAGLSDGIIRLYKEYDTTTEQRNLFTSTVVVRGVILAFITTLIYIIVFPFIHQYLKIDAAYITCFMIMAAYLFIRPLNIIVLNLLRILGKTTFMNSTALLGRVLSIVLSLTLLIYVVHDLYGYFIGVAAAEIMVAIILFRWFFKNYKIGLRNVSGELTLRLIKFGAPLLLTELSFLLLTYIDRYMILAYRGENILGLYSVGYNLAMYISDIITFALSYAIVPLYVQVYSKDGRAKTEEFLKKALHYVMIVLIPLCVGYYAVSEDLFTALASKKYSSAAIFSPLILVASLFLGMNNILNAGLYLKKKTKTILGIMISGLIIKVIMNLLLLPHYGAIGAAIATLIACAATSGLTAYFSFKHIVITVEVKTILFYLMLSVIMLIAVQQIRTSITVVNLIAKIFAGMIIISSGMLYKEKVILEKIKFALSPNNPKL